MAAASLLEAEVVTADGVARTVNAARNPDLFWALKGGGGGSFGVVTRVTLQTRTLPETFGAVFGSIKAGTDKAYRQLIGKIIDLYAGKLFNEYWGEQVSFHGDNTAKFSMVFQGLSQQEAQDLWQPFEAWVKASPEQYTFEAPLMIIAVPAKHFWDAAFLEKYAPGVLAIDDRLGAPEGNRYWQSNKSEAGQFLWGYHSAWMPARLLEKGSRPTLANALFEASRHWTTSLHFNKGLAGAPPSAIAAAKDTATNPAMLEAFALAIIAGESEPVFPGIKGHEPDLEYGRRQASSIHKAKEALFSIVPGAGSYLAESNFFQENWQRSFWGTNYDKLKAVKKKYDPEGLFFVHHGVGSEAWSPDGFTRIG